MDVVRADTHYVEWDRFMDWYRDASGPDMDQASLDYYDVFAAFAHAIVCEVVMGEIFARFEHPDLGYLHFGLPIKAYFVNEPLRTAARATKEANRSASLS